MDILNLRYVNSNSTWGSFLDVLSGTIYGESHSSPPLGEIYRTDRKYTVFDL